MERQYKVETYTDENGRKALHYIGFDEARANERYEQVESHVVEGATVELLEDGKVVRTFTRRVTLIKRKTR